MKKIIFLIITVFLCANVHANTHILVLGDSLSEGIGLDEDKTFPRLLEKNLQAKNKNVSITNGGISGSTTASGLSRLKWHLKKKTDVMILELGGNDGLRGIDLKETEKNLRSIIAIAKEKKIKVLLLGLLMPPNYGKKYVSDFEKMYKNVAETEKLPFLPFLLKDIAGIKEMNLSDGIHPNEKGHEKIAKDLTVFVEKNI